MKQRPMLAALLGIMCVGSAWAAPYTADPYTIVLFHFDEAAGAGLPQDSSPYANHPDDGPPASGDAGVFGNAMAFTNTVIRVPDDVSFDKAQTNGFVEFWMKPDATSIDRWGGDQAIVVKNTGGNHAGDFSMGFRMNPIAYGGGQFQFLLETGTGTYRTLRTPGLIKAVQWYHVVVSWDSVNKPTITVDGVEQALSDAGTDTSYVGPIFTAIGSMLVGVHNGPAGGYILLDELRIVIPSPPAGTLVDIR